MRLSEREKSRGRIVFSWHECYHNFLSFTRCLIPRLCSERRSFISPGPCGLYLSGKAEEGGFIATAADKLRPDGKALSVPIKWHRQCRLAGHVGERAEGDKSCQTLLDFKRV